jgi:hypothetical protein
MSPAVQKLRARQAATQTARSNCRSGRTGTERAETNGVLPSIFHAVVYAPLPCLHQMIDVHALRRRPGAYDEAARPRSSQRRGPGLLHFLTLLGLGCMAACANSPPAPLADAAVPVEHCVAPAGTSASPHSIADAVNLLNALPKPVSLPCFIESLARPLEIHATVSRISAQPSVGARSPRIFLFYDGLRLSIALGGVGSSALEFGEIRDEVRSLKAEIGFPVTAQLGREAPFERILYKETGTSCSFCHATERAAEDITFTTAFTSLSLRPPAEDGVSIDVLSAELAACDAEAEPDRCAMLKSLFERGAPIEQAFPASLPYLR